MGGIASQDEARRRVLAALASGKAVTDIAFDRVYPERIRKISSKFWTPVTVARRVGKLFAAHGARRVLDVGAGVGKLCIVAALDTELELVGIEHRKSLVEIAKDVIDTYSIPRVTMIHGTLDDVDLDAFDGFYLYNPFEEAALAPAEWADRTMTLSPDEARRDVARMESFFSAARKGTCVVTYHGFGGAMPEGFVHLAGETRGTAFLRLWVRG
jgi:SAM-dependent methyltransferase